MKVVLTGTSGLVGSAVASALNRRGLTVRGTIHENRPAIPGLDQAWEVDLAKPERLTPNLLDWFPDTIINCAAISNPASCDADPDLARRVNVELPTRLAEVSNHLGAKLIHLSTDMVFPGIRGRYRSTDPVSPTTLYGNLKAEAEEKVLHKGGDLATVLRLTIVTGNSPSEHRSVHEKLFEQWAEGRKPRLFTDELRQPCSADNLAEVIVELAERRNLHGLFHWAGAETLSRYEMGCRILEHFNLPEDLIEAASLEDDPAFAERPRDLTLETEPLRGKIKTEPVTFERQLEDLVVPRPFRKWYHEF